MAIKRGSAVKFPSWMIDTGESLLLLFFIDIIDLIPFQVFLRSLLLLLKKSVKYCCLESLRRVESKFQKDLYFEWNLFMAAFLIFNISGEKSVPVLYWYL